MRAVAGLPPLSPVLNKLMASLANEDISFGALGELIEKDPVLAGNVLRLVNSALYARRGSVNSVRHAVSILGLGKVRNLAISLSVNELWKKQRWPPGFSPKQFNLHAAACAVLSDQLALEIEVDYPEGAFTAGLLANLGLMPIALGMGVDFAMVRSLYEQGVLSLIECERKVTGIDHAWLSGEVLGQWKLPEPIQTAAAHHHDEAPPSLPMPLGQLVRLAELLAEQQGILCQDWHRPAAGLPSETLAANGLSEKAPGLIEAFHAEFDALRTFFQ